MHVAITGATGLVGTALSSRLAAAGHRLTVVSRSPGDPHDAAEQRGVGEQGDGVPRRVVWAPATGQLDPADLEGVDAVVHLAGAPIAAVPWTASRKRRIRTSRTLGTDLLARTLAAMDTPPRVLVSASGINYYGDRGDDVLTEDSPSGTGFLSDVCVAWERATQPAADAGIRVVNLRTSVIQSVHGLPLRAQLLITRLGVGGWFGSGEQYLSWITVDDLVSLYQFALEHDTLSGPVNATAPHPVTQREYARVLGRILRRPLAVAIPTFAPRLLLGEVVDELLAASMRVLPERARAAGFVFRHPTLEDGLAAVVGERR